MYRCNYNEFYKLKIHYYNYTFNETIGILIIIYYILITSICFQLIVIDVIFFIFIACK